MEKLELYDILILLAPCKYYMTLHDLAVGGGVVSFLSYC